MMKSITLLAVAFTLTSLVLAAGGSASAGDAPVAESLAPPRIFLIGDSTMADRPTDPPNPGRGWGQLLPKFFKPSVEFHNHALGGRSSRSFIDEGHWQTVASQLRPDEWVIIQFGHNDEKPRDSAGDSPPQGDYAANLRRYVRDAREHGAHPLLCPPVMRRRWNEQGQFYDTHGEFPEVARRIADAENVPLLDLHALTRALIEGHGQEGSKALFLWIPAGTYARKPEGWQDDSHFSAYGAERVTALAVQEMLRLQLPLTAWLK